MGCLPGNVCPPIGGPITGPKLIAGGVGGGRSGAYSIKHPMAYVAAARTCESLSSSLDIKTT